MWRRAQQKTSLAATSQLATLRAPRILTSASTLPSKTFASSFFVTTNRCSARMISSTAPTRRKEKDTIGEIDVPSDKYWGAQTQRFVLAQVVQLRQ